MTHSTIIPTRVYPIGEFASGQRLCAEVKADRVDWFPEFRDFDLDAMYALPVYEDDEAPTLRDEEVQALGHAEWWDN